MARSALSVRQRRMVFQIASVPFLGIGNGMPTVPPVTPLPPSMSAAVVAILAVAS